MTAVVGMRWRLLKSLSWVVVTSSHGLGRRIPKREAIRKSWWDCRKRRRVVGLMSRVGNGTGAPWCVVRPVCSASAVGGGSVVGSSLVEPAGRRVGVGEMTKDGATGRAAGGGTADADAAGVAGEVGKSRGLTMRGSGWVVAGGGCR